MNLVIFSGRVGKDPEPIKDDKGVRFSVASSERYKDSAGEWKERTTWMNVQAWGSLGKFAMKHLRKGDRVLVRGKINIYEYNNKSYTNLLAESIEPGVFRKDGDEPAGQRPLPGNEEPADDDVDDDDIPF